MEDKILEIARRVFDIEIAEELLDKDRDEIEEWDSLAHLQLLTEIEEKFGIEVPFEEVQKIRKLSDFIKYLKKE